MVSSRLRLWCSSLFFSLILVGCGDDPSNLGLGLVDVQAGEPFVVSLVPTAFEKSDDADFTGGFLGIITSIQRVGAARFLVGSTSDPSLGLISAEGRLDFVTLEAATDDFRNGQVSSVILTMDLNYVYGDTLTPVTLKLSSISDAWSASEVRSDTVLSIGEEIMEISVDPTTDQLEIELPDDWVSANDALLRSESLSDDFHGFHLSQIDGDAVVGFSAGGSFLRIAVASDTLRVAVNQILTAITRDELATPAEFLLLQDGVDIVRIEHDFDTEEIKNNSIHQAVFRLNKAFPSLITPAGYYRPPLETVTLVAITGDEESRTTLDEADVDDDGVLAFQSINLIVAMQNTVLGRGDLVRFELHAPIEDNSLSVLFFERSPESGGPRLHLTVTEVRQ